MLRVLAGLAAAVVLAALAWNHVAERQAAAPAPDAAIAPAGSSAREPGVLRFAPASPQLSAIKSVTVQEAPLPVAEPLNARIAYDESVTTRVGSPIAGRAMSIRVEPGDAVRAGQPLALLDSPDLAAAIADLRKNEADETRKRLAFERARTLFDGGVAPRKELEVAEADLAQSRAETQRARLRLQNLRPQSADGATFALRAPLGGVVADRRINPGMEVRPDGGEPLFTITDPTRLWVLVDLPERDLGLVQSAREALVEVDAYPGRAFPAKVARIGEVVDPATRRVTVRCTLANPERLLKPEMFARVVLLSDRAERAVRIPNGALIAEGVRSYVFVETEPGTFVRREVRLARQDREVSYLAGGLSPGERVVTHGALLLASEMREGG